MTTNLKVLGVMALVVTAATCALLAPTAVRAQTRPSHFQEGELVASDGAEGDLFGYALAIAGTTVVVGAPSKTIGSNEYQGAAYVFFCANATGAPPACTQHQELTLPTGVAYDAFGLSVTLMDGSLVAVGAVYRTITAFTQGAAYLYACPGDTSSCTPGAELVASDAAEYDYFGSSIAASGSLLVVGASNKQNGPNINQGAAYLFSCANATSCTEIAKLLAADGEAYDQFGYSVAISGSLVVVGAANKQVGPNTSQGMAYLFSCYNATSSSSCTQIQGMKANNGATNDTFGAAVAISGPLVIVGAPGVNNNQGSVYIFSCTASSCTQGQELLLPDGAAGDSFGIDVAISGSLLLVGADGRQIGSNANQGAVYMFSCVDAMSCSQTTEVLASNGASDDGFGDSVAIDGSLVLVGAYDKQFGPNTTQGAAYIYSCNSEGACTCATGWAGLGCNSCASGYSGPNCTAITPSSQTIFSTLFSPTTHGFVSTTNNIDPNKVCHIIVAGSNSGVGTYQTGFLIDLLSGSTLCCAAKGIYDTTTGCNRAQCSGDTTSDSAYTSATGGTTPPSQGEQCIPLSSHCYTSVGSQAVTTFSGSLYIGNTDGETAMIVSTNSGNGTTKRSSSSDSSTNKNVFAIIQGSLNAAYEIRSTASSDYYGCVAQGTVQGMAGQGGSTCEIASGCSTVNANNYFYSQDSTSTCYTICASWSV